MGHHKVEKVAWNWTLMSREDWPSRCKERSRKVSEMGWFRECWTDWLIYCEGFERKLKETAWTVGPEDLKCQTQNLHLVLSAAESQWVILRKVRYFQKVSGGNSFFAHDMALNLKKCPISSFWPAVVNANTPFKLAKTQFCSKCSELLTDFSFSFFLSQKCLWA